MALLSKELHRESHHLENPIDSANEKRAPKGLALLEDSIPTEDDYDINEESQDLSEHLSESSTEEEEEEGKTMPKTPKKSATPRAKMTSPPGHCSLGTNSPGGPARYLDSSFNPIPYPMMAGYWEKIDFNNNMKATGFIMVRMIVHPGVEPNEVECEWQSPTLLKIRFRWPQFFSGVLPMMEFDTTNEAGVVTPKYGRDHQLTISLGKFVAERMDDNNEVWDEGYLTFDRAMDTDDDKIDVEILKAKHGHKSYTLLQIVAQQAHDDGPKKSKAKVKSRDVKTGTSAGKNYPNIRTREQEEDNMDERSSDDESDTENKRSRTIGSVLNQITHNMSTAIIAIGGTESTKEIERPTMQLEDDDDFSL